MLMHTAFRILHSIRSKYTIIIIHNKQMRIIPNDDEFQISEFYHKMNGLLFG